MQIGVRTWRKTSYREKEKGDHIKTYARWVSLARKGEKASKWEIMKEIRIWASKEIKRRNRKGETGQERKILKDEIWVPASDSRERENEGSSHRLEIEGKGRGHSSAWKILLNATWVREEAGGRTTRKTLKSLGMNGKNERNSQGTRHAGKTWRRPVAQRREQAWA